MVPFPAPPLNICDLPMQPGLRVIPGRLSTPRTAGGSSADKPEHLWSESPAIHLYCISVSENPALFMIQNLRRHVAVLTRQEEASSLLLQHPEMCQSLGPAGVPVSHYTGQKHPLLTLHVRWHVLFHRPADGRDCFFLNVSSCVWKAVLPGTSRW